MLQKKRIFLPFIVLFLAIVGVILYLARPMPISKKINYGITFSKPFAEKLGLDWKALYAALLDDLGIRKIRLSAYWDEIETQEGSYNFDDLLWQVQEAEKRNAEIILAVGRKLPRWPECHVPGWVQTKNVMARSTELVENQKLLDYITATVNNFKNNKTVKIWQVENEPFLPFGECPKLDKGFLKKEIELVRSLDPSRSILITDSGELGRWIPAARLGDIFGTTMYFQIYHNWIGQFRYPLGPGFFRAKSRFTDLLAGKKPKIVIEFQFEPWNPKQIYETALNEQLAVFPESEFEERMEFVKKTGFDTVYFWGAEWWYWLGQKHNQWGFWDKARNLFKND